jgi:hypothetical protein
MTHHSDQLNLTPMERISAVCDELRYHYEGVDGCEIRIAAKALLVALERFQRYGDNQWPSLVQEYIDLAVQEPEKFQRILESNRSEKAL